MERVTCRDAHGNLLMDHGPMPRGDACTILLERCAAYEDTELTPEEVSGLREEIKRLQQWVSDLQSGMYVNCVYCGHRYGPADEAPVCMADVLKEHIEHCPKHPMSMLKAELEGYREREKHGVWFSAVDAAKIAAQLLELNRYREQNKEALGYMGVSTAVYEEPKRKE